MTDDRSQRFEQDLSAVLRQTAGDGAPASLRYRLADVTATPPLERRSWFAPPLRWAAVAVAVIAVAVLAFLMVPHENVGPTPTSSAQPTASASSSGEATPTGEPSPTASPSVPPSSTPVPTPQVAAWVDLTWTQQQPPEGQIIGSVLPWRNGFVATGSLDPDPPMARDIHEAFFASSDGLQWTLVDEDATANAGQGPQWIVTNGDKLVAVSYDGVENLSRPLLAWVSSDGRSWTRLGGTWDAVWKDAWPIAIAGGPTGVVAIGEDGNDRPIIVRSSDLVTWSRETLSPVFASAVFRDMVSYGDGFVIVGRDGAPDTYSDATGSVLGVGRPAAWISPDGLAWTAAEVEGNEIKGAELSSVGAGANGLYATGIDDGTAIIARNAQRQGWASADGRSWRKIDQTDPGPADAILASDGTRIIALGGFPRTVPWPDQRWASEPLAWSSTDGVTWTSIGYQGAVYAIPSDVPLEDIPVPGAPGIAPLCVTPQGVIASWGNDAGQQLIWLGQATSR